jgi:purine-nucleoside phosphorylase
MSELIRQINESVNYIQSVSSAKPRIGVVLGSGLGNLAKEIEVEKSIAYSDIPHFPISTVEGHSGKLIFGKLNGVEVLAMSGRFHSYEGYTPVQISYPIRVMKNLGVETLLLSNASGAVNPAYKVGELVIINDHISFLLRNPLIGKNEDSFGTRFPDMSEPYSKKLIALAHAIGERFQIPLKEGVYVGSTGPTFETHAEYRMIKIIGGDLVGMSTVQEVIVARHAGMSVFAVSVVTDLGIRDTDDLISHHEVLQAANEAEPKLAKLFKEMVAAI